MAVYQLDEELWFPDPYEGESDGFIAVGGDLSVPRLLLAYSHGFFPWFAFRWYDEPHWYCPLDRFVIFPEKVYVSRSMKKLMRQQRYKVTFNQDFGNVIRNCSTVNERDGKDGAWLGNRMIEAYTEMHRQGFAISVEVWEVTLDENGEEGHKLVGGLYGIKLGKAFCGESMFSLVPNASKLALIRLAKKLSEEGCCFIDCQFETPHLRSMGGEYISYEEYMDLLEKN